MAAAEQIARAAARLESAGLSGAEAEQLANVAHGASELESLVERRLRGAPLGLLLGKTQFLGLELEAAPGALAPRAETELLGKLAIDQLRAKAGREPPRVVDVCCGAGNLACAVASAFPEARVLALDLTDGAVEVARRNVARLGFGDRIDVLQGDLFAPLGGRGLEGCVDLVVCNPPYISTGKLAKERATLLEHEPREAFDGGPYGLSIHQRVIKDAAALLRPAGILAFEFGLGQERQLELLFARARAYTAPGFIRDAEGRPRACSATRLPPA